MTPIQQSYPSFHQPPPAHLQQLSLDCPSTQPSPPVANPTQPVGHTTNEGLLNPTLTSLREALVGRVARSEDQQRQDVQDRQEVEELKDLQKALLRERQEEIEYRLQRLQVDAGRASLARRNESQRDVQRKVRVYESRTKIAEIVDVHCETSGNASIIKDDSAQSTVATKSEHGEPNDSGEEATQTNLDGAYNAGGKRHINFMDAVGRKFSFPYHICRTWQVWIPKVSSMSLVLLLLTQLPSARG